jgi:hypothetical protein
MPMTKSRQEILEDAWLQGSVGSLSALSQAKLWAARAVWRADKKSDHGVQSFAARLVKKCGTDEHPSQSAVRQFYAKIDADPAWFPGKIYRENSGPSRVLSGQQTAAIARSAEAMKRRGAEPTYPRLVGTCPTATLNRGTGAPVSKKRVYAVFREQCKDEGSNKCWVHKARYSKIALTAAMRAKRLAFGLHVKNSGLTQAYVYKHVVWTDLCNSILPRSEQKATEQALARKGNKGWTSPGAELHSVNLRGAKTSEKQHSWDTIRVWWAPILTRGKLHIEVFDADFPGEVEAGAMLLVAKVRAAVNKRFQNGVDQPDVLWTDRGKGFYHTGNGLITGGYKQALTDHGFRAALGDDASVQPGNLQELMLHETAVAWIRLRLGRTVPAKPWDETRDAYTKRLKEICVDINANLNVDKLSRAFRKRILQLVERKGGRLAN